MNWYFKTVFLALLCSLVCSKLSAQNVSITADSLKTYRVVLKDGAVLIGNIVQQDTTSLELSTLSIPYILIPKVNIKEIEALTKRNTGKKGNYWFPNPHATRYLIAPSAINLKKKEGFYQNTYLLLHSFDYGITNHISIGGGIEMLSAFALIFEEGYYPIFFLTPKIGYKVAEKWHVGASIIYVSIPTFDNNNRSHLVITYGLGTYGTPNHNITGGLGWMLGAEENRAKPIITISGMTRVSSRLALITENWIVPVEDYPSPYMGTVSYGVRFLREKLAIDLAFANNKDFMEITGIGIPWIDFVLKF